MIEVLIHRGVRLRAGTTLLPRSRPEAIILLIGHLNLDGPIRRAAEVTRGIIPLLPGIQVLRLTEVPLPRGVIPRHQAVPDHQVQVLEAVVDLHQAGLRPGKL